MRRLISFVLASTLLGCGLYLLHLEIFVARTTIFMFKLTEAGGLMAVLGAGWLWEDFIGPWWRGDDREQPPPRFPEPTRLSERRIRWHASGIKAGVEDGAGNRRKRG
jgi:hypothetical protein